MATPDPFAKFRVPGAQNPSTPVVGSAVPQPAPTATDPFARFRVQEPFTSQPSVNTHGEEFAAGFLGGLDNLQGSLYGLASMVGRVAGIESLETAAHNRALKNFEDAAASGRQSGGFTDIEDAGGFFKWTAATLGEAIPSLGSAMAAGGLGGIAAKKIVENNLKSTLSGRVARNLQRKGASPEEARAAAHRIIASKDGERWLREAVFKGKSSQELMRSAWTRGATKGAVAVSAAPQIGQTDLALKERGIESAFTALVAGSLGGALEALPALRLMDKLFAGVSPSLSKQFVKDFAIGTGQQALLEGGTEGAQEIIQLAALAYHDPSFDMFSPESRDRVIDAFAAGALVGIVTGGAAEGVKGGKNYLAHKGRQARDKIKMPRIDRFSFRPPEGETLPDGFVPADRPLWEDIRAKVFGTVAPSVEAAVNSVNDKTDVVINAIEQELNPGMAPEGAKLAEVFKKAHDDFLKAHEAEINQARAYLDKQAKRIYEAAQSIPDPAKRKEFLDAELANIRASLAAFTEKLRRLAQKRDKDVEAEVDNMDFDDDVDFYLNEEGEVGMDPARKGRQEVIDEEGNVEIETDEEIGVEDQIDDTSTETLVGPSGRKFTRERGGQVENNAVDDPVVAVFGKYQQREGAQAVEGYDTQQQAELGLKTLLNELPNAKDGDVSIVPREGGGFIIEVRNLRRARGRGQDREEQGEVGQPEPPPSAVFGKWQRTPTIGTDGKPHVLGYDTREMAEKGINTLKNELPGATDQDFRIVEQEDGSLVVEVRNPELKEDLQYNAAFKKSRRTADKKNPNKERHYKIPERVFKGHPTLTAPIVDVVTLAWEGMSMLATRDGKTLVDGMTAMVSKMLERGHLDGPSAKEIMDQFFELHPDAKSDPQIAEAYAPVTGYPTRGAAMAAMINIRNKLQEKFNVKYAWPKDMVDVVENSDGTWSFGIVRPKLFKQFRQTDNVQLALNIPIEIAKERRAEKVTKEERGLNIQSRDTGVVQLRTESTVTDPKGLVDEPRTRRRVVPGVNSRNQETARVDASKTEIVREGDSPTPSLGGQQDFSESNPAFPSGDRRNQRTQRILTDTDPQFDDRITDPENLPSEFEQRIFNQEQEQIIEEGHTTKPGAKMPQTEADNALLKKIARPAAVKVLINPVRAHMARAMQGLASWIQKTLGLTNNIIIMDDTGLRLMIERGGVTDPIFKQTLNDPSVHARNIRIGNKSFIYLSDYVLARPDVAVAALGHELGHHLHSVAWDNLTNQAQRQLRHAYESSRTASRRQNAAANQISDSLFRRQQKLEKIRELRKNNPDDFSLAKQEKETLAEIEDDRKALKAERPAHPGDFDEAGFKEWMADQLTAWLTTKKLPRNAVEKFFFDVSTKIKKLFEYLTGKNRFNRFTLNETYSEFVEAVVDRARKAESPGADPLRDANMREWFKNEGVTMYRYFGLPKKVEARARTKTTPRKDKAEVDNMDVTDIDAKDQAEFEKAQAALDKANDLVDDVKREYDAAVDKVIELKAKLAELEAAGVETRLMQRHLDKAKAKVVKLAKVLNDARDAAAVPSQKYSEIYEKLEDRFDRNLKRTIADYLGRPEVDNMDVPFGGRYLTTNVENALKRFQQNYPALASRSIAIRNWMFNAYKVLIAPSTGVIKSIGNRIDSKAVRDIVSIFGREDHGNAKRSSNYHQRVYLMKGQFTAKLTAMREGVEAEITKNFPGKSKRWVKERTDSYMRELAISLRAKEGKAGVDNTAFIADEVAKMTGISKKEATAFAELLIRIRESEIRGSELTLDPVTGKYLNAKQLMEQLAKELKPTDGTEFSQRRGYTKQQIAEFNAFVSQARKLFPGKKIDDLASIELGLKTRRDKEFTRDELMIRQLFDEMHKYAVDSGLPVRKIRNYFPRQFNQEMLIRDREKILKHLHDVHGMNDTKARSFYNSLVSIDAADGRASRDAVETPGFKNMNSRTAQDKFFNQYLDDNLDAIVANYINAVVKRSEFNKALGQHFDAQSGLDAKEAIKQGLWDPKGRYHSLLALAKQDGATDAEMQLIEKYIDANLGQLGRDDISPGARKIMAGIMGYQNMRVLLFTVFASLPDLVGPSIRAGSMRDAFRSVRKNIHAIASSEGHIAEMARAYGIVSDTMNQHIITEYVDNHYMPPKIRKMNDAFFKYTGLNWYTSFTRKAALAVGIDYIQNQVEILDNSPDEKARFRATNALHELGLTAKEVKQWIADGKPTYHSLAMDGKPYQAKIAEALFQFVDESIMRPNPAQRPIMASHPAAMLVYHLKNYFYSVHEVVLKRMKYNYDEAQSPLEAALVFGPALAMMMLTAIGLELRELVQYAGSNRKPPTDRMDGWEYTWELMQRSGLTGIVQLGIDLEGADDRGMSHVAGIGGPTLSQIGDVLARPSTQTIPKAIPVIGQIPAAREAVRSIM